MSDKEWITDEDLPLEYHFAKLDSAPHDGRDAVPGGVRHLRAQLHPARAREVRLERHRRRRATSACRSARSSTRWPGSTCRDIARKLARGLRTPHAAVRAQRHQPHPANSLADSGQSCCAGHDARRSGSSVDNSLECTKSPSDMPHISGRARHDLDPSDRTLWTAPAPFGISVALSARDAAAGRGSSFTAHNLMLRSQRRFRGALCSPRCSTSGCRSRSAATCS